MKIEIKGKDLRINGRDYHTLTYDDKTNVWLRCVPAYLGHLSGDKEGFNIEI